MLPVRWKCRALMIKFRSGSDVDFVTVLRAAKSRRSMADGFDIVTVRIADEGAVIVGGIRATNAGRAVAAAPGGQAGRVEGIDLGPRRRADCNVDRWMVGAAAA